MVFIFLLIFSSCCCGSTLSACLPGWSLPDCSVYVPPLPPVFAVRPQKFPVGVSGMFPTDDVVDLVFENDTMVWFSRNVGKVCAEVRLTLRGTENEGSNSYHVHIVGGKFLGKRSFGLKRFEHSFCFGFVFSYKRENKSSQAVDSSLVRERLAQRMFESAGCVVPREAFARVSYNGTNLVNRSFDFVFLAFS